MGPLVRLLARSPILSIALLQPRSASFMAFSAASLASGLDVVLGHRKLFIGPEVPEDHISPTVFAVSTTSPTL